MGYTTLTCERLQNTLLRAAALTAPATFYAGLLVVPNPGGIWTASTAKSAGAFVVPTGFGNIAGQQGRLFKATIGGTTGAAEPNWPNTEGGTVTDGTVTWTEITTLFQAGTFSGAEPVGNNYARVAIAASASNFSSSTAAEPTVSFNSSVIAFPPPTADWGYGVGAALFDAATGGNAWWWGLASSPFDCPSGQSPALPVNGLAFYLSSLLTA